MRSMSGTSRAMVIEGGTVVSRESVGGGESSTDEWSRESEGVGGSAGGSAAGITVETEIIGGETVECPQEELDEEE